MYFLYKSFPLVKSQTTLCKISPVSKFLQASVVTSTNVEKQENESGQRSLSHPMSEI